MKKLILWDFDGVIVNTYLLMEWIYKQYRPAITREEITTIHNKGYGKTLSVLFPDTYDAIQRDIKGDGVYAANIERYPLFAGIKDIFAAAKRVNYTQCVLCLAPASYVKHYLKDRQLLQYFPFVLGSETNPHLGPKIEFIRMKTVMNPADVVYVTDTVSGIQQAKEHGIDSIGVTWGYQTSLLVEAAQPTYITTNISDLQELVMRLKRKEQ